MRKGPKSSAKNSDSNWVFSQGAIFMVSIVIAGPLSCIWGMKWAKKLKTKNGQNMSCGPFSHDAAHFKQSITNFYHLIQWTNQNSKQLQ